MAKLGKPGIPSPIRDFAIPLDTDVFPGQSYPLGATVFPEGVNFCVFSKHAILIELLLFDDVDAPKPSRIIALDPSENKTFYYWHVFVFGVQSGQIYGYRVYGPNEPVQGHRYDGWKLLIDPYAKSVVFPKDYDRLAAISGGDNCARAMRSVVVDTDMYDWEGDHPLERPYSQTVIYELHVRGFTQNVNSGVSYEKRGKYAGLVEKIPYLKQLGITAVELLPVQQFDEQSAPNGLKNYWGYSPVAFFAPHASYSSRGGAVGPLDDFRDMVKAFHRAGLEVILDIVLNHTAEGDENGPTFCFRGFENRAYYMLKKNRAEYANFTGCGNTVNGNHSIVRRLVTDCLQYWATEMHVDGFRFDLASVLARDELGVPLESPPLLWSIESDPVLAGTKIIAEAWDAAGLYQVGSFIGHKWAEWNGRFRDDARRFIRGDNGTVRNFANRITGSPDLYPQPQREPNRSINFVTSHDGFTLNDLVTYEIKHNEANLENNRDGFDYNDSRNWGVEGPSDDPEIESLRLRQIKNFLTILLIAQGTPMILMGDEVRRTQNGNNNAYAQDNEISWFDWNLVAQNVQLLDFLTRLIAFVQGHSIFREERLWTDVTDGHQPRIRWHGVRLNKPDWSEFSHSIAFSLGASGQPLFLHAMVNAYTEPLTFELPPLRSTSTWLRILDTSLTYPNDFRSPEEARSINGDRYQLKEHSCALFMTSAGRLKKHQSN